MAGSRQKKENPIVPINVPILLITRTSWMHAGLQVLLLPLLKEQPIDLAQDVESAKNWAAEHPQGVWIIDADSFPVSILSSFKDERKDRFSLPCVAITNTFEDYAIAAQQGIEAVLLRGFSIEELTAAIYRAVKKINISGGI